MCNVSSMPCLLIKSPAAHKYVNFMFNYFTSLHILPVPITNQISLYSPPSMIIFLLTLFSHEKNNRSKAVEAIHTSVTSCGHPLESLNTGTATHYSSNIMVIPSAYRGNAPSSSQRCLKSAMSVKHRAILDIPQNIQLSARVSCSWASLSLSCTIL